MRLPRLRTGRREGGPVPRAKPSRADTLLASSVLDAEYYAAAVGLHFPDDRAAARHCVREGMPQSVSPSPLLTVDDLPRAVRDSWRAGRVGAVLAFLRRARAPLGPLFDAGRAPGTPEQQAGHPGGALGLFLEGADQDTPLPVPDSYRSPPPTLGAARRALTEHVRATHEQGGQVREPDPDGTEWLAVVGSELVDWASLRAQAPARDPATVSVVIPTYRDWRMTADAVAAVLGDDTHRVDVVVVDNGSPAEVGSQLVARFLTEPRVRYRRLPQNLNFAIGCNVGFADATARTVVFLNNDTVVRPGWLDAMLPHLDDPQVRGVQPLLLFRDGTVQSAGTVFCDSGFLPVHLLTGHPAEDARRLAQRPFSAVTAAALAVRATEFAELEGFDPLFANGMEDVDYCLRARETYGGGFVVEPRAEVTHLEGRTPGRNAMVTANRLRFMQRWRGRLPGPELDRYAELGLTVAHLASDGQPVSAARPVVVRPAPDLDVARPRLRWGIRTSITAAGSPLLDALSEALRRLGQEVVTYRGEAHFGPGGYLDDVALGIGGTSGPGLVAAQPGKLNILWLFPDAVAAVPGTDAAEEAPGTPGTLGTLGPEDVTGFDLVCSALPDRAPELAETLGHPVLSLPGPDRPSDRLEDQAEALLAAARAHLQGADPAGD